MKKFLYIVNNFTIASILPVLVLLLSLGYFFYVGVFIDDDFYSRVAEISDVGLDVKPILSDLVDQLKNVLPVNSVYEYQIKFEGREFDFSVKQPFLNVPLLTILNYIFVTLCFIVGFVIIVSTSFTYLFSEGDTNFNSGLTKAPLFFASVFSLFFFIVLLLTLPYLADALFVNFDLLFEDLFVEIFKYSTYKVLKLSLFISGFLLFISIFSLLIGYFKRKNKYDAS